MSKYLSTNLKINLNIIKLKGPRVYQNIKSAKVYKLFSSA